MTRKVYSRKLVDQYMYLKIYLCMFKFKFTVFVYVQTSAGDGLWMYPTIDQYRE